MTLRDITGGYEDDIIEGSSFGRGYQYGNVDNGLVAYYPLEFGEFQTAWDAALDNHGSIKGGVWTTTSTVGDYGLSFGGTDEIIDTGITESAMESVPATYAFWFKLGSTSQSGGFVRQQGSHTLQYNVNGNSNINWATWGNNTDIGPSITDTNWHHVVLVHQANNNLRLYLDGTEYTQSYNDSPDPTSNPLELAGSRVNSSSFLNVDYAEWRTYERPLSASEAKSLYNLTSPSGYVASTDPRDGLIHEYKLDGDATDSVGSADGTNSGVTFVNGYEGQAGEFYTSESDWINVPDNFSGSGGFTVTSWVKRRASWSATSGENVFFTHTDQDSTTGGGNGIIIGWTETSNRPAFGLHDGSGWTFLEAPYDVPADEWVHYAATWNGTDGAYFINGSLVNTGGTLDTTQLQYERMGAYNITNAHFFDGEMDETRIYNRAISPLEVQQLFEKGRWRIEDEATLQ